MLLVTCCAGSLGFIIGYCVVVVISDTPGYRDLLSCWTIFRCEFWAKPILSEPFIVSIRGQNLYTLNRFAL